MQEIGFLELSKKLYNQNLHLKMSIISIVLSVILLISFSFTIIWMPPFLLYGSLLGFFSLLLSFFLLYLFYVFFGNTKSIRLFGLTILFIRLIVIICVLLLVILIINPLFFDNKGVKLVYQPINIFTLIGTYSTFMFSPYIVFIYDFILKKNIEKNKIKEWNNGK